MKQIFLVFIVLMIGVGGYFFLIKSSPSVSERLTIEKEWVVDTVRVAKIDSQPTLHLSGKIVAAREADLRPLVEGRIIEIGDNFHEGGLVSRGEILIAIDPFNFKASLTDSEAALSENRSSREEILVQIRKNEALSETYKKQEELRKLELERRVTLSGEGIISKKANDESNFAYLSSRQLRISNDYETQRLKAKIKRLDASILRSEVRVDIAKRNLNETILRAPFDGVLTNISVGIGKWVNSRDYVAQIIDNINLEVLFHMSDEQYGRITSLGELNGRPAMVVWSSGVNTIELKATLNRAEGEFDAASGGVWVYASVHPNGKLKDLRPGAFVQTKTPDIVYPNSFRVIESAIYSDDTVYLFNNGRLEERVIKVVARDGEHLIITGEVQDGDLIVTTRIPEVAPGLKVRTKLE
ncbi:MAG: hypothetical protein CL568_01825 [Alphaproteobacteria bacterium]|jgi:RND family efflux transporter MFP subunit|nr:hypothetical protein [Alphaproteobacteria bacterium]PPR13388.1 MAG: Multidrug resistance protein MdtA [Alphaproteobacteria bacterium MarineAlpha12_Bin1]|tara:strand:+ start:3678 stop:4913 length:1236 start_codon:yes stop_codon:yes gene_type:complete